MTERQWNPWTVIRTTNPLFYLAYAGSSILLGAVAFLGGTVGFVALPWVANLVCRWERARVTLLGLPPVAGDDRPVQPWLWSKDVDVRDLGGWALTVGMGGLTSVAALVCLLVGAVPVAILANGQPVSWLIGGLGLVIAVALTLMAAAALSGWQASLVRRLFAPDRLQEQVRELTTSRARIVGGFEVERRRIERDLHDGAQQFLVASSMKVGEAAYLLEQGSPDAVRQAAALLSQAQGDSDAALRALRETVAGIHPKVLSDRGLEAAVRDVAARQRAEVTVQVPTPLDAVPPEVAAAAYYLVAECLTNAAKHAPGAPVHVLLSAGADLRVTVTDRGPGGAVARPGGGLEGLAERFAAMGGAMVVHSPAGGSTQVTGVLPMGVVGSGLMELGEAEPGGAAALAGQTYGSATDAPPSPAPPSHAPSHASATGAELMGAATTSVTIPGVETLGVPTETSVRSQR